MFAGTLPLTRSLAPRLSPGDDDDGSDDSDDDGDDSGGVDDDQGSRKINHSHIGQKKTALNNISDVFKNQLYVPSTNQVIISEYISK